jgi:hypothetical protein
LISELLGPEGGHEQLEGARLDGEVVVLDAKIANLTATKATMAKASEAGNVRSRWLTVVVVVGNN